jgi:hypothetical protein
MSGLRADDALMQAKNFAKKVALGITSVTVNNVNKTITFTLLDDGSQHTLQFDELSTAITSQIKSDVAIGNVTVGKVYPVGTRMEEIIKDMLTQYTLPSVRLDIQPSATLYDVVNDTVSEIKMNATITKGTGAVAKVEFYVDDVLVNTVDTSVTDGGLFNYVYRPATPINADTVLKVVATDDKNGSANAKKTIKFVAKSYYGIIDASIGAPAEAVIKTMNGVLKDTKNYVYDGITTDWGKVCYAYPSSFGNLSSIKDAINNLNYTTSFTKTTVTVDGVEYVCYTQTNASAATDIQLTFA